MEQNNESLFGRNISIINRAALSYFSRVLKPHGIGPGQQAYLLMVEPGETLVQEDLAQRLQVDKANVTRALAALENQGLVVREMHPTDKRARQVRLTAKGIELRQKVVALSMEWISRLKAPLSNSEWHTMERLLARVAASLED